MHQKLENLLKSEIDPAFAKRAGFIFQEIERKKPKKILDAGCGRGFYVHAVSLFPFPQEIHGIDLNKTYIAKAKSFSTDKRIQLKQASIYTTGFPSGYFDCIIFSEVLEHLEDEKKALKELKRILNKNGIIILTVPEYDFPFLWDPLNWILMKLLNTHINKDIWWLAGIWADHIRLYKQKELKNLLEQEDFTIEKSKNFISLCWPFSHFLLYGIGKNMVERLGAKNVDRFNFQEKKFSKLIAKIMKFPSRFENNKNKNYVNTAFLLLKK